MTKRPKKQSGEVNHLRAWRENRRMTQEALGEAVGTTGAVISLLESGDRGLSGKWLRKLAPVLGTTPGHLLDYHPDQVPADIWELWTRIADEDKERAAQVLNAFRKAS